MQDQSRDALGSLPPAGARDFYTPSARTAYALMLLSPALFSSNMVVARATADYMPPIALAFWRWAATFLIVAAVTGPSLWRARRRVAAEWRDLTALGALGMGVCGAFVYFGAHTTSGANIGIIYATSPVFIIVLGRLLYDETMSRRQLAGVALAIVGVVAVAVRADLDALAGLAFTVGDFWIFGAAIGWAFYSILLLHRPSALGLNERLGGMILGALIVMLPFVVGEASITGHTPPLEWRTIGWLGLLAVVSSYGSYQVYALVQRSLGAGRAGVILYLNPLYSAVLAWALLDEPIAAYHLIGAALILPGIWLATHR
ncbi:MAG TPA: DMT family transporter [Alphaproteobacteria bacterium]|nr:DMT family transporter [Alphaproteobacteria bacterium]